MQSVKPSRFRREFRPICNGDRKNPDFDICFDFSKWIVMIIKQEHIKEYT